AAVIEARGASSAASAANGIVDSVYSIVHDTPEGETYSMCLCSEGQYGVDEGLIYSFACRTENGKLRVIDNIKHNEFAEGKLAATLNELRAERDIVRDMGLIGQTVS
ncbi:MAG: malate dehydrogenase, partial [Pseudomonadota bacterium]|nr:malate dehydrogenase [Pseudomonadota bacterium]